MNNFHSDPPLHYHRWLTPLLRDACEVHPVVVLTGARQVGKSTLLRRAEPFASWRYHTLDDFDALRQVRDHPASLWAGAHEVVLDEVQKAPELLAVEVTARLLGRCGIGGLPGRLLQRRRTGQSA